MYVWFPKFSKSSDYVSNIVLHVVPDSPVSPWNSGNAFSQKTSTVIKNKGLFFSWVNEGG